MSTTSSVLPDNATVEQVFKTLDTETTALFEQLDLLFLTDYPVFAPLDRGRTRVHEPPELLKGVLHCFYMRSTVRVQWRESSTTRMSGGSVASRVRRLVIVENSEAPAVSGSILPSPPYCDTAYLRCGLLYTPSTKLRFRASSE